MNVCPVCGYVEKHDIKMPSNVMSRYVRLSDKAVVVVNSTEKELKNEKGEVVMMLEGYAPTPAAKAPFNPVKTPVAAPVTAKPIIPTKTVVVPPTVQKTGIIQAPVVKETGTVPPVTLKPLSPEDTQP